MSERGPTGKKVVYFSKKPRSATCRPSRVACGRCIGCRLDKSREWAIRCQHEAQYHDSNSFITLTFANDPVSLVHKYWQDFMKRLRDRTGLKLQYYMCGEYGNVYDERGQKRDGLLGRPHFHALLFGFDFPDRTRFKKSNSGFWMYQSDLLDSTWKQGHALTQDFSIEAAAYVARYVTKKISGPPSENHYKKEVVTTDGEIVQVAVKPEYTRMSLKPAIGKKWLEEHYLDCYPKDFVTHAGVKFRPPRYYDKYFEDIDPEGMAEVKASREAHATANQNSRARLEVMEQCKLLQNKRLIRPL